MLHVLSIYLREVTTPAPAEGDATVLFPILFEEKNCLENSEVFIFGRRMRRRLVFIRPSGAVPVWW